jgi:hypothetical protein
VLTTTNLYLGAGVSAETDGQPSATATLDTLDDGVTRAGIWQNGLSSGTVEVKVGKGTGWLVGFIDFNRDGTFQGEGEMIVSSSVTTNGGNGSGVYTWPVAVPTNSILSSSNTTLYARFRVFPAEPAFPEVAYSGLAENGEVEDYRWDLGSINGKLWSDANRNGLYDGGELPLESVRVFVDQNTNGLWEAGEPYALTETNGLYGIGGLPTGSFTICVETNTLAEGLYLTTPPGATNNQTIVTLVTEGQVVSTANFGYATQPVQIGDLVWNDLDADGIQDVGEPGLTNVTVRLLDSGSNLLFTTVTDVNGAYTFTNLDAATYLVEVVAPPQFVFTIQDSPATNDLYDSDVDISGRTAPFTLTSGMTDLSLDAGLSRAARIYGYAFYDINTNLVRNARVDYPIANMTVTLWRASTQVASTLTSSDGTAKYEFANLLAGSYTIRFAGATNLLEALPSSPPASTDPERNRAAVDGEAKIAIAVAPTPGEGVDFATEPKNAGFIRPERPLSESVSIRAYMTADGVLVEFTTSGEEDYGFITLWVWMDGGWVELGSTLAVGFGSNTYSFDAPGLVAGERYYFQAMDEVGYLYDLYGVEVMPFAMELQVMERTGVRLSWATVPDRWYGVYTTQALGSGWTLLDMVWAEAESTFLDVRIDPAEPQRFFKIEMFRDDVITEGGAQ